MTKHQAHLVTLEIVWRKSSRSANEGGQCVEVGAWRKSSRTNASGANCVETALINAHIAVRDSKHLATPPLTLSHTDWAALLTTVKAAPPTA